MCGIAGEYKFNGKEASLTWIERAALKQNFRGPDSYGVYQFNHFALAHRRLKIFDIHNRSNQPMIDTLHGLSLVFNGAIYNFKELRNELIAKGFHFDSNSDTEVILKAYAAWREDCIPRFYGMFAFAICEHDTGKMVLARDRMGIKPLYYSSSSDEIKFASTLPALLEFEGIDTSIDKVALHYYLTFHIVPEPLTILSGIKKIPAGHYLVITPDGKIKPTCYWQFKLNDSNKDKIYSENDWIELTKVTLEKSIKKQLVSDVPLGILLSGGLDSSLLVSMAAQNNSQKLETFSIGFESLSFEKGDEFFYSRKVAEKFGTNHNQILVSNEKIYDAFSECVESMSEPLMSHDSIGFYLISKEVAKYVKVILSGQGADELFAGYHWFQNIPQQKLGYYQSGKFILNHIADRSFQEYYELINPDFYTENHTESFLHAFCKQNGSEYPLDNLMAFESTFALANGPLARVDNMTMASGLEARVPFLDEQVVDLAAILPNQLKLKNKGKYILKKLAEQYLSTEIIQRPKGYFPVPAIQYLKGQFLHFIKEVLSPERIKARGIFKPNVIQDLFKSKHQITPTGASKIWQLGLLEYWLEKQKI